MRANRTLLRLHVLVDNIRAMVGTTGLRNAQFHPASRKGDGGNVLVVLIGWWLAKEKHLAKYLPIWHENGCATFSFVPNFLDSDFSRMAEAMMDNLAAYLEKEPDTIIIFHVFSNNGVLCLIKSLGFSRKSKRHAEVHNAIFGCIFDSCPGYLSVATAFNAFLAASKRSFLSNFVFKCICYVLLGWLSILFFDVNHVPIYLGLGSIAYGLSLFRNKKYHGRLTSSLLTLANCKLNMFLYSKSDKLCTSDAIESFMENIRGHKVIKEKLELDDRQVFSECFSGSRHVAHYLEYPTRYKASCKKFLDRVLHNVD